MKNTFITILFLLLSLFSWARPQADVFRGLSVPDGLSDLLVNVIYKDSAGYVWLGTGSSLDRFDGVHVKPYSIPGGNEQLKRVNALAEMPGGRLWMGNGAGLWRLNRETGALEQVVPETIGCAVNCLLSLRGVLYVGTERGLFIYDRGTFEQVLLDGNVFATANAVTAICEGTKGRLWLATRRGLYALYLSDHSITAYHNVLSDKHLCSFRNMARIGDVLYLGTMEQGIVRFDTRTGQFSPYVNVGCNVISSLSSDGKSLLYVGTDGNGVHFVDVDRGEVVRSMRHEAGNDASLRSNSVYSLLVDRDGIIWVGFYQFGLNYTLYQNDLFSVYAYPPHFDSKDMPIRAIAINGDEKLIGSRDGLFYIDTRRGIYRSFRAPQLRSEMVFCILHYEGEYYVGTYGGGMYVFNPQTLSLRDFDASRQIPFQKGHVFCLREDAAHRLWIGTSAGLYCYQDGALSHYTSGNSKLPDGNVYEIYFDSAGKGWICTENGMCIWDPSSSSLRTDIFPEGFVHKEKIRVVYEDAAHNLYFFPDKGALFLSDLTMNAFRRLQPGTPLEGRDGLFIIEDAAQWLWIGTSDGLFHYDKRDNFVPYNFVDGIPSSIFTLCPPVLDASGRLWLGNSKGLVYMDVADVDRREENLPPVRVTDVHVNGKSAPNPVEEQADGSCRISLNSSQKNVTFCFSDFTYTAPAYMSYEYKLEGKDENWVAVTGRSDVTYYNLPSGSYLFKVRRMGEPASEDRLTVSIAPPFMLWAVLGFAFVAFVWGVLYVVRRKREARPSVQAIPAGAPVQQPQPLPQPQAVEAEAPRLMPAEEKYKSIKVDADECQRMLERLDELMRKEKLYTNPELKIADLAATLHTTTHLLSYLFNHHLNRNYYDFLNDYRIEEFKRLVASEEYAKYTLAALAELCGFSSRASFFRYFKKATGITPNEYIRNLGAPNE